MDFSSLHSHNSFLSLHLFHIGERTRHLREYELTREICDTSCGAVAEAIMGEKLLCSKRTCQNELHTNGHENFKIILPLERYKSRVDIKRWFLFA